MQWMYDKYKLDINKASLLLKRRDEMLQSLQFEKEFFIVLYEEPEGSPRPRARYVTKNNIVQATQANPGFIQVYSLTGAVDRKFMSQLLTDKELDDFKQHMIYTPCYIDYRAYIRTPKSFNVQDTYLAEMGLIRPIVKPDFDNIAKKYADMYNGNVWIDDALVIDGRIRKYYSILPRVEITLQYLNMLYCKSQYKSIQSRLPDRDIKYFK
jgi:Holliday junction resolvase RusA-like endonuclease